MVEELSEKNLHLSEELAALKTHVKGLQELQEANEEIEYVSA